MRNKTATLHAELGFTFIELLIGIVIMALIFGVGFANYRGFQERQGLINAARVIRGDLRFAQEQALAGVKPVGCTTLNGYSFEVSVSGTFKYDVFANCDAGVKIATRNIDNTSKYPTITLSPNPTTVYFYILGRGVQADRTITITDSKTGQTTSVSVTVGGQVN